MPREAPTVQIVQIQYKTQNNHTKNLTTKISENQKTQSKCSSNSANSVTKSTYIINSPDDEKVNSNNILKSKENQNL